MSSSTHDRREQGRLDRIGHDLASVARDLEVLLRSTSGEREAGWRGQQRQHQHHPHSRAAPYPHQPHAASHSHYHQPQAPLAARLSGRYGLSGPSSQVAYHQQQHPIASPGLHSYDRPQPQHHRFHALRGGGDEYRRVHQRQYQQQQQQQGSLRALGPSSSAQRYHDAGRQAQQQAHFGPPPRQPRNFDPRLELDALRQRDSNNHRSHQQQAQQQQPPRGRRRGKETAWERRARKERSEKRKMLAAANAANAAAMSRAMGGGGGGGVGGRGGGGERATGYDHGRSSSFSMRG